MESDFIELSKHGSGWTHHQTHLHNGNGYLQFTKGAVAVLGLKPGSEIKLLVNPKTKQIRVEPDGVFILQKGMRISAVDLRIMPNGDYIPTGGNTYTLREGTTKQNA